MKMTSFSQAIWLCLIVSIRKDWSLEDVDWFYFTSEGVFRTVAFWFPTCKDKCSFKKIVKIHDLNTKPSTRGSSGKFLFGIFLILFANWYICVFEIYLNT